MSPFRLSQSLDDSSVVAFLVLCLQGCSGDGSETGPGTGSGGSDSRQSGETGGTSPGGSDSGPSGGTGGVSSGGNPPQGGALPVASGGASGGSPTSSGGENSTGGAESGGGPSGGASGVGGNGGTEPTGGTTGCDGLEPLALGDDDRTLEHDGQSRSFIFHVPPGYDASEALPLLIDMHGLGGSGAQQRQTSGFQSIADAEGFFVVWPNGVGGAWDMGQCCTNEDVDDVGFIRAIVDEVSSLACVDPRRIYAAGFSNGGGLSNTLGCEAADLFAAIAPSAFDLLVDPEQVCDPSQPIHVLSLRGTNDTVVPYGGGPGSGGRVSFAGAEQTLTRWAALNGCTGEPELNGDLQLYTNCEGTVQVGLHTIQGGGHAPGGADVAWDFLKDKTKSTP